VNTLNEEWLRTVKLIRDTGMVYAPRGLKILEVPHGSVAVDMHYPVLTLPGRKLGYRFMAAEAAWILSGSDRLDEILPWSRRMADFSDDGATLRGAYGPRFVSQLDWVVAKLLADPDTRQATMTLWTPRPAASKDVPCTVALDFKLRDGRLNLHAFMRSSDAWLGLPYDVFSFTMMAARVLGTFVARGGNTYGGLDLGTLYLTAASSHLYLPDVHKFSELDEPDLRADVPRPMPRWFWAGGGGKLLIDNLIILRNAKSNWDGSPSILNWWENAS
jgi:thymidylate synthase